MRILLVIVGGLALVIAVAVVTGLLLPKRHRASRSATFRAPAEKIYALISGPQTWRPDVFKEERVADPRGREMRRETTRNKETIMYELLDATAPTGLTRRIATPNLPYSGSWRFALQPAGGGTLVRITEDGEVYNPIFRFVSRFIMGHTSSIDAYLRALGGATGEEIQIGD